MLWRRAVYGACRLSFVRPSPDHESHKHEIGHIVHEALEHERARLCTYYELLGLVRDKSGRLEEYTRDQIKLEEQHIAEVEKMMRKPGD